MTRAEAALVRDVVRWSTAHLSVASLERAAAELLDVRIEVLCGRVEMFRPRRPFDGGIGVLLAGPAREPRGGCILIEAEQALAAVVVARAVRRPAPQIVDPGSAWSPALAGSFAAVLAALARRTHSNAALPVLRVGPSVTLEAELTRSESEIVQVALTVLVERDAFAVRALISGAGCLAAPPPGFSPKALAALGAMPLTLPLVACASQATAADVGALRAGDAFMPGTWSLSRSAGGGLRGLAWLATPNANSGVRVELADDGRIVLAGDTDLLCKPEDEMVESNEDSALVSAVGDIPVVVRVEIGEARMAAREWAALARGDVIALGRRLGDGVVLRVGGIAIARGELVDIEGEVGVRIGERLHGERTDLR